jgi:DNA polymerase I-like protein with 3'-5' exonuclease and polymerase domains
MDMTRVLTDVELAGIKIDTKALAGLKRDYNSRIEELLEFLKASVKEVMGDTPINLDSPEDRSILFYSRKVNNKKEWASLFNIGTTVNERGSRRQKKRTEFNRRDFRTAYQTNKGLEKLPKLKRTVLILKRDTSVNDAMVRELFILTT